MTSCGRRASRGRSGVIVARSSDPTTATKSGLPVPERPEVSPVRRTGGESRGRRPPIASRRSLPGRSWPGRRAARGPATRGRSRGSASGPTSPDRRGAARARRGRRSGPRRPRSATSIRSSAAVGQVRASSIRVARPVAVVPRSPAGPCSGRSSGPATSTEDSDDIGRDQGERRGRRPNVGKASEGRRPTTRSPAQRPDDRRGPGRADGPRHVERRHEDDPDGGIGPVRRRSPTIDRARIAGGPPSDAVRSGRIAIQSRRQTRPRAIKPTEAQPARSRPPSAQNADRQAARDPATRPERQPTGAAIRAISSPPGRARNSAAADSRVRGASLRRPSPLRRSKANTRPAVASPSIDLRARSVPACASRSADGRPADRRGRRTPGVVSTLESLTISDRRLR